MIQNLKTLLSSIPVLAKRLISKSSSFQCHTRVKQGIHLEHLMRILQLIETLSSCNIDCCFIPRFKSRREHKLETISGIMSSRRRLEESSFRINCHLESISCSLHSSVIYSLIRPLLSHQSSLFQSHQEPFRLGSLVSPACFEKKSTGHRGREFN